MPKQVSFFVGVTGAQGVGKSTFCRHLQQRLEQASSREVVLLGGIGERIAAMGIPPGSTSTSQTIAAVFTAHLERERNASARFIVLDRCVIDALAYTRALTVGSDIEMRLYEHITALAAERLDFVVYLTLSPPFTQSLASHETPELRVQVAQLIPSILTELNCLWMSLDAAADDALDRAVATILDLLA